MINFAQTTFNRIILHKVHKKESGQPHSLVDHDDQLVIANETVRTIIKKRASQACGSQSKAFVVQIEKSLEGSFFHLCNDIILNNNKDDFIKNSKSIATLLGRSQTRSNSSSGMLVVIHGATLDKTPFVMVIKAELQDGFTAETNPDTNQRQIAVLDELFLTSAKKFYKIGLLYKNDNDDQNTPNDKWSCMLYDQQIRPDQTPAKFFYSDFLGFTLEHNAKILSKDFLRETTVLITNSDATPREKTSSIDALRSVLNDQRGIIDPVEFGQRFIPDTIQIAYSENILSQPRFNRPFLKDLTLVRHALAQKVMKFSNKISLKAPAESFDNNINVITSVNAAADAIENPAATLLEIKGLPYDNA